jgi:hypothetical protein
LNNSRHKSVKVLRHIGLDAWKNEGGPVARCSDMMSPVARCLAGGTGALCRSKSARPSSQGRGLVFAGVAAFGFAAVVSVLFAFRLMSAG